MLLSQWSLASGLGELLDHLLLVCCFDKMCWLHKVSDVRFLASELSQLEVFSVVDVWIVLVGLALLYEATKELKLLVPIVVVGSVSSSDL